MSENKQIYEIKEVKDSQELKSDKFFLTNGEEDYTDDKRKKCGKILSYYCGVDIFKPANDDTSESSDKNSVLLVVRPQFGDGFDIIENLLDILKIVPNCDEELFKNLKNNNDNELIKSGNPYEYMFGEITGNIEPLIVYSERSTDSFTSEQQDTLNEIRDLYNKIKTFCPELPEMEDGKIFPFAINMSLLLEFAARAAVFAAIKDTGWQMQKYVKYKTQPKSKDDSSEEQENGTREVLLKKPDETNTTYFIEGKVVPDIVLEKEKNGKKEYIILDAKYKNTKSGTRRNDRLQILAYAYLYDAHLVGNIFPVPECKDVNLNKFNTEKGEYKYIQIGLCDEKFEEKLKGVIQKKGNNNE